jgi:hypothetical protein
LVLKSSVTHGQYGSSGVDQASRDMPVFAGGEGNDLAWGANVLVP